MTFGRRLSYAVALLLLAFTGVVGLYNGVTERSGVHSTLQATVTGGVLMYGVLGLAALYGALRRRPWARWSIVAWSAFITYVSGAAALAYGDGDASVLGAVSAALGGALVGAFVLWALRPATASLATPRRSE